MPCKADRACALALAALLFCCSFVVRAELRAQDDAGDVVVLRAPAQRIVSLAPHVTELLFAAGAGARVVATMEYSDYPAAARVIPRIGGSGGVDLERVVALKPDLVVGWASGNPKRTIARLRELGLAVYLTEPRRLEDIVRGLEDLGRLAGVDAQATEAASRFRARQKALAQHYAGRAKVRVFYQVLDPQLTTVNGEHVISEVLRLCGGENVFADLPVLAPIISEEAVLKLDPGAIVAVGTAESWRYWRARWERRKELTTVQNKALYFIYADLLHRHSPRILDGAEQLCAALEDARRRR